MLPFKENEDIKLGGVDLGEVMGRSQEEEKRDKHDQNTLYACFRFKRTNEHLTFLKSGKQATGMGTFVLYSKLDREHL